MNFPSFPRKNSISLRVSAPFLLASSANVVLANMSLANDWFLNPPSFKPAKNCRRSLWVRFARTNNAVSLEDFWVFEP